MYKYKKKKKKRRKNVQASFSTKSVSNLLAFCTCLSYSMPPVRLPFRALICCPSHLKPDSHMK